MSTVQDRVKNITARILQLDPNSVELKHHFYEDLGGESIQSVELFTTLEGEFDIRLDEAESASARYVSDLVKMVDKAVPRKE
jgi:acyl carrier protein